MSVHALACVLGDGRRGGNPSKSASQGSARLVLVAIANHANDWGMCWPSIPDQLAPAANVHRGTVNRNLDELIRLGEIRMFRRGHYQSPAFVMTIVDHPLTTQEIVDRLVELDDRAEWRERLIDPTTGEPHEVPVPGQGALPLTRSSQDATISENDTPVIIPPPLEPRDQGVHPSGSRENPHNDPSEEMVADRDNLGEIVASDAEIVASDAEIVASDAEIVAMTRRSSEPSLNHLRTARGGVVEITELELRRLAVEKAKAKGAHNVPALAAKILREDSDLLEAELREQKTGDARAEAITDCTGCDTSGFRWETTNGESVPPDHPAAHTAVVCGHTLAEALT